MDIDEAEAAKAKQRAAEALRNRSTDVNYASAEAELAQAITHLIKKNRGDV